MHNPRVGTKRRGAAGAARTAPLFGVPSRPPGAAEQAVATACRQALSGELLDDLDEAAIVNARAMARALDEAMSTGDVYAAVAAGGQLRACLASLRLDPSSRASVVDDQVAALLDELAAPAT